MVKAQTAQKIEREPECPPQVYERMREVVALVRDKLEYLKVASEKLGTRWWTFYQWIHDFPRSWKSARQVEGLPVIPGTKCSLTTQCAIRKAQLLIVCGLGVAETQRRIGYSKEQATNWKRLYSPVWKFWENFWRAELGIPDGCVQVTYVYHEKTGRLVRAPRVGFSRNSMAARRAALRKPGDTSSQSARMQDLSARARSRRRIRPRWNPGTGELSYELWITRKVDIKRAKNLVTILDAFEAAQWPVMIADPLGRGGEPNPKRLRDAVGDLNAGLTYIRFSTDGGDRVVWATVQKGKKVAGSPT